MRNQAEQRPIEDLPKAPEMSTPSLDEALTAAHSIDAHRHNDVLGATLRLRRNLGRNALLVSHTAAVTLTTAVNGYSTGAIPTGLVYETAGGAVVGGALYGAARLNERRRVNAADKRQAVIRGHLGEPVDMFRVGRRRSILRWYGCDDYFRPTTDDCEPQPLDAEATAQSLARIAEFAKKAKIPELAMSSSVLGLIPNDEKAVSFGGPLDSNRLTSAKRVQLTDEYADPELFCCTTENAKLLAKEIREQSMKDALEVAADLLAQVRPEHPFIDHAAELRSKPTDEVLIRQAKGTLRSRIEQTASNGTSRVWRVGKDGSFECGREYTSARLRGTRLERVGITQIKQIKTSGRQTLERAYGKDGEELLQHLGFSSVTQLLADTKQRRLVLAPAVIQERTEAAAWLLLHKAEKLNSQMEPAGNEARPNGIEDPVYTLQQRLAVESPRSIVKYLRKHGRNVGSQEDEDQHFWQRKWNNADTPSITFEQNPRGRLKRALGSLVMLGVVSVSGTGAGLLAQAESNQSYSIDSHQYALHLGYKNGELPLAQTDNLGRYLKTAPGEHAAYLRGFGAVSEADNNLLGVMARHTPGWLLERLGVYVDRSWAFERQEVLKGLDNVYSNGLDGANIGDVFTNPHGMAWALTPQNGAKTDGYWPQAVQSTVVTHQDLSTELPTPPYRDFAITYEPEGLTDRVTSDPNTMRNVPIVPADQLPNEGPFIVVRGSKDYSLGSSNMAAIPFPSKGAATSGSVSYINGYPLPVQLGADIVAAQADEYSLNDNRPMGRRPVRVVQAPNGTFYMAIEDDRTGSRDASYMSLSYWIKPNAGTALPVRADAPMTVYDSATGKSARLDNVMSTQDALATWRKLSGDPTATRIPSAEEAARQVSLTKGYSFTPYIDSHVTLTKDKPARVGEGLGTVGQTIAEMPIDNCNLTETVALLASRGGHGGNFVNATTGYHNNGDNKLETGEAHAWLTANAPAGATSSVDKSLVIDGTPSGSVALGRGDRPGGAGSTMNHANAGPDLLRTGAGAVALLGFVGAGLLTRRFGPRILNKYQVNNANSAAGNLYPDPDNETEMARTHDLISIVQWMQNAPASAHLDEAQLPEYFVASRSRDLRTRCNAMPVLGAKQMRQQIDVLEAQGRVTLSAATKQELIRLVRHHKRAQAIIRGTI